MFTETMASVELNREYEADLPELQFLTKRFDNSEYVTNVLRRKRKMPTVSLTRNFTTSRGNRYIGVLYYSKDGDTKNSGWMWSSVHIGLMSTFKGQCALMFLAKSNRALKLTPHFFYRYKERLSKSTDWKTRNQFAAAKTLHDIISIYIRRNPHMTYIETQSIYDDKTHIFSPVADGVALMHWDQTRKVLQANTFITEDMLNEKQRTMVGYARLYPTLSDEEKAIFEMPDCFLHDD